MKTIIIDTNALISFVTDRNPKQQAVVSEIFQQAARLKALILCHQHVLTEFVFVLEKIYRVPKIKINRMVRDMIAMPGIQVVHEIAFSVLLKQWPEFFSDFEDAIIASLWKQQKDAFVITFDRKFAAELNVVGANVIH